VLRSPPPDLKRPPLNRWSRAEIIDRANRWGSPRGWEPVTDTAVLDWKKNGLLPRVGSRSLGRGRGTEGLWSGSAYRQLLRVMQLRASGVRRRRDLRLRLWLEGYEVPWLRVRADLQSLIAPTIRVSRRELGAGNWKPTEGEPAPARVIRTLERHLAGPEALASILADLGLPERVSQELARWLQRIEVRDILVSFGLHLLSPSPETLSGALERAMASIPEQFRPSVTLDQATLDLFAGVLMPPATGKNRAWASVRKGEERLLSNLRDFATNFDQVWSSTLRFGAVVLRNTPTRLPRWAVPLFAGTMESLAALPVLKSPESRLVVVAMMLNRRGNLDDHAESLRDFGLAVPPLLNWLADNPQLLGNSPEALGQAQALALNAHLPDETKELLRREPLSEPRENPVTATSDDTRGEDNTTSEENSLV